MKEIRNSQKIKIAFLCGASQGEIPDYLEIYLLERGILPEFFIGGYNRYYEDAVFGMELFAPDIIYFCTSFHNIQNFPEITDGHEEISSKLEMEFLRLKNMWDTVRARFSCVLIQNNFEYPPERVLGNLDGSDQRGLVSFITALNAVINEYARQNKGFYVMDINYLAAREGLSVWHNAAYMHLYKYSVSAKCMPSLAFGLASLIASVYGRRKKCIVLDLDNTIWGGVIGEVGVYGIKAGNGTAEGEAFAAFQRYLKKLSDTGVLLAVASKNEEETAISGFSADGMVLKKSDFCCVYANWEPKHKNIKKIAEKLNIGLDSLVFIDDNPAERELIRGFLPTVSVIEASEPIGFLSELDKSGFFEPASLSADDIKRGSMYRQNAEREKLRNGFSDYGEYLKSLSMKCIFSPINAENAERASSLINKTNQFNLTGRKFTQTQVSEAVSDDYITICGRLSDKFGDNGLVTVFIGRETGDTIEIIQWVMSCRVFGRGLEQALFDEFVRICRGRGVKRVWGAYVPTQKNRPVEKLYQTLGFTLASESDFTWETWQYEIPQRYELKNSVIEVINND